MAERKKLWVFLVPLALFLVLFGFMFVGLGLNPRELPSPLIGKAVPEFRLTDVQDERKTFSSSDLLGKVSLINAWASWCVSCRQEHHVLMHLSQQLQIPIYGINWKDERVDALGWLQGRGNPYLASGHDLAGTVGIEFGVIATPETFLVDKKGIIRHKHTGPLSMELWNNELGPLVEQLQSESS